MTRFVEVFRILKVPKLDDSCFIYIVVTTFVIFLPRSIVIRFIRHIDFVDSPKSKIEKKLVSQSCYGPNDS